MALSLWLAQVVYIYPVATYSSQQLSGGSRFWGGGGGGGGGARMVGVAGVGAGGGYPSRPLIVIKRTCLRMVMKINMYLTTQHS